MQFWRWPTCFGWIGLPATSVGVLYSSVYLFLSAVAARLGTVELAILGLGNRAETLTYLVSSGFGAATAAVVGQNLGARQVARAAQAAWRSAGSMGLYGTVVGTVLVAWPREVLALFTADAAILDTGATYTRIIGLCQGLMAVELVLGHAFAGAGDTLPPMLISVPLNVSACPVGLRDGLHFRRRSSRHWLVAVDDGCSARRDRGGLVRPRAMEGQEAVKRPGPADPGAGEARRVRVATRLDLQSLVDGNVALAHESEALRLEPATVRAGVSAVLDGRVPGRYFVLEDGGIVVAQLLVTHEWSDWRNRPVWWIASVYVAPERRRQGLFAVLYRAVVDFARRAGAAGVRLYVDRNNHAAMRVYEALGMNGEHYTLYEDMFDAP